MIFEKSWIFGSNNLAPYPIAKASIPLYLVPRNLDVTRKQAFGTNIRWSTSPVKEDLNSLTRKLYNWKQDHSSTNFQVVLVITLISFKHQVWQKTMADFNEMQRKVRTRWNKGCVSKKIDIASNMQMNSCFSSFYPWYKIFVIFSKFSGNCLKSRPKFSNFSFSIFFSFLNT